MTQNLLEGTWKLVSCEIRNSDGQVFYPFGHNPVGYLIYNDDGFVSVTMMKEDRPKCGTETLALADQYAIAEAARYYQSYCGKYEIQGNTVTHHIEASLFPDWTGKSEERVVELQGGQLSLTMPPFTILGIAHTGHIVWDRV